MSKDFKILAGGLQDVAEGVRTLCNTVLDHEKRLATLEENILTEFEALKARISSLPEEKQEEGWKLFYELSEVLGIPVER